MKHIQSIEQLALEEMVFNAAGVRSGGIFRTYLASKNFLAAVHGGMGKTLFYGHVDVSYLGDDWDEEAGQFLAFKLRDQVVRVVNADLNEPDTAILFDRIEVLNGTGASNPVGDVTSLSSVIWDQNWLFNTDENTPAIDCGVYAARDLDGTDDTTFGAPPPTLFQIPTTHRYMRAAVTPGVYVIKTAAGYSSPGQRFVYEDIADAIDLNEYAADTTLWIVKVGEDAEIMGTVFASADSSFAKVTDGIRLVYGTLDLVKPDDVGFVGAVNYKITTNKTGGTVRIRTKKVSDNSYTTDQDTTVSVTSAGTFVFTPTLLALATHAVTPLKFEFYHTPAADPSFKVSTIKHGASAGGTLSVGLATASFGGTCSLVASQGVPTNITLSGLAYGTAVKLEFYLGSTYVTTQDMFNGLGKSIWPTFSTWDKVKIIKVGEAGAGTY